MTILGQTVIDEIRIKILFTLNLFGESGKSIWLKYFPQTRMYKFALDFQLCNCVAVNSIIHFCHANLLLLT